MPAMATTGSAQKGCSMLATSSPMATAMVVAGMDAFSATAAGMVKGPCTAQCPPPLGMMNEMKMDDTKLRTGNVAADAEAVKRQALAEEVGKSVDRDAVVAL